ncbi:MAG: hypothetical protein BGO29_15275 [Bacteroidales bacterium 36-12]|jgi:hypothetical protein|nr:MAG: hypothetical protein BGO29_15275 [Bacteroidales bacterium 36-12]
MIRNYIIFAFLLVSTLTLTMCNTTGEIDTTLTAVESLIEPIDGKEIVLLPSASASTYFEWDYADLKNSGPALYQIAFDKADGDFSQPAYIVFSDKNGYSNNVTVSHKQLNKIAGMLGITPSETGDIKWTVLASKGTKTLKSKVENIISIKRLAGFAEEDIPVDVYITGAASEGGSDISKAQKMKAISTGEFEIYTEITEGAMFHFVDSNAGTPNQFSIADGLVLKDGESSVNSDGVYRIIIDFNTGASTVTLVEGIGFFFSPSNALLFELPYVGNGIFKAENQTVTFKQEGWGRDERYKFRMFVKENYGNDDTKELEWSTLNQTDSRPTPSSPESYYYLKLTDNLTQWDNKWKLMADFDDVPANYTIYLQADKPYTHSITK